MGKKFVPVAVNSRFYKLFLDDLRVAKGKKIARRPPVPNYHSTSENPYDIWPGLISSDSTSETAELMLIHE